MGAPFTTSTGIIQRPISEEDWQALLEHGGFPEPFVQRSSRFSQRWWVIRKVWFIVEVKIGQGVEFGALPFPRRDAGTACISGGL